MCYLFSCVWLFVTPMGCSPPGSSVHRILQARISEWVAIPFSGGSSQPRDQAWVSRIRQILFHLSHQRSSRCSWEGSKGLRCHHWLTCPLSEFLIRSKRQPLVWVGLMALRFPEALSMSQVWRCKMAQQGFCWHILKFMNNHLFHPITLSLIWFFLLTHQIT